MKVPEEDMLLNRLFRSRRALIHGWLIILTALLLSTATFAQEDETPKYEIFTGYQWLHPGGTTPASPYNLSNPIGINLPDLPKGSGESFTYFFNKYVGGEVDFGGNWNDFANEITLSVGPHFEVRHERVNWFFSPMLGWNRLTAPGLSTNNGFGAILGGGM